MRAINPIGVHIDGAINPRQKQIQACQESAQQLQESFNRWLNDETFDEISQQLRSQLNQEANIHLLIRTDAPELYKLPWQQWDLLSDFPQATIAFTSLQFRNAAILSSPELLKPKPRILAILGHSQGIDVDADRKLLQTSTQADLCFLVEPDRQQISDRLWEDAWDIIFFARTQ